MTKREQEYVDRINTLEAENKWLRERTRQLILIAVRELSQEGFDEFIAALAHAAVAKEKL